MKLIHCADLHIGSKMDSKYPAQKAKTRRQELRNAFVDLVEEAGKIGAEAILISGDAFDSDHPGEKDLEYFYKVIAAHPSIEFFYLRGNHDIDGFGPEEPLPNLHTFSQTKWKTYLLPDKRVTISGFEITEDNQDALYSFEGLKANPGCYNIGMLHGQIGYDINLKKLAHHGFHYLALGHIHSYQMHELDDKAVAVYPGTLEPRGFDETGEKGFVIIDTDKRQRFFQPFNKRTIHWEELDISGLNSGFDISNAVKAKLTTPTDIYRIELTGEKPAEVLLDLDDIASYCQGCCFLLDLIDKTKIPMAVEEEKIDTPLIKEFVAKIKENDKLTEAEKAEAIQIGIKALAGKEF